MGRLSYHIGRLSEEEEIRFGFSDALSRSVDERIMLGLVRIKIPVMDDRAYRIFSTMEDYRRWAATMLPRYLGYYRDD
ncbi:hypothetical protein DRP53_06515 [candidate division WOR-3 bacterium]|uniref:Uncharacterized protein n=1 Tax=candidate division WOR-3 bacterium TaxID=2052148 RepID=A0A660SGM0_UNCW3|nr:MAG: hypothetical protein DRP53_06515 [candidate division WOR-3 bacterium]